MVLKKYHLHTEITKHGSSLKWFWSYMILHLLWYFLPEQKRVITLYYTVKSFCFSSESKEHEKLFRKSSTMNRDPDAAALEGLIPE